MQKPLTKDNQNNAITTFALILFQDLYINQIKQIHKIIIIESSNHVFFKEKKNFLRQILQRGL